MRITKFGHCCLYIQIEEFTVLTDPGVFSEGFEVLSGIDVILITHEHPDHLHIESVHAILARNPDAEVISNSAVGKLLTEAGIPHTVVEGTASVSRKNVRIAAHDGKHEEIYRALGQVQNTGYLLDEKLFYPGDAFHNPHTPVEVLALPVAGPWCRVKDAISYALLLEPKKVFPVHDGVIAPEALGVFYGSPQRVLSEHGIDFVPLKLGESLEC